ncbi:hypothetical protein GMD78_13330 [Ornithinibacillus sp. L9]|uniref:Aminopeptidase n=1 Tax=Ornithinibacillus caprae TaxID=2678566 RepID=A0A6N8FLU2_9BACI|nr:hypothetical protein [Ornithinibacillus caprae]MUK89344.1 hypothetical protein [Ornithinibacillus caprae]
MQIIDTYPDFPIQPSKERLQEYYAKYPDIFDVYFTYHCKNKDEKLLKALTRYEEDVDSIQRVHYQISELIEKVVHVYGKKYGVTFPIDVNLIVGAYGSNAYTHRQIIPNITFAMERLTFEKDPLKVIIAHEFGHATHNIITDQHHLNWKNMHWEHPYIWLLQEGAATHFSKEIVPDLHPSIYFSYDLKGEEWFDYANNHKVEIIRSFFDDIDNVKKTSGDIFKEWFSINGGMRFGYTRLAYFIADCMFQDFIHKFGEINTVLLWKDEQYFNLVDNWFKQYRNGAVH